jgi:hypothetical protein
VTRRAAALALLALAGCHDEDELTIHNTGGEPVLVEIDWETSDSEWYWTRDHDRFVEIPAGGVYHDDFGFVREMDVVIVRKSDGLLLFAGDFDAEDFEEDHGDIEITVNP